jgi:hypothetical protein
MQCETYYANIGKQHETGKEGCMRKRWSECIFVAASQKCECPSNIIFCKIADD